MNHSIHTTYFGSVDWYRQLINADEPVHIDANENYVKQTSRNRCEIATANGKQILTIPVTTPTPKCNIKDVIVSEHGNWRHHHWEALKSAYGMSPFFDYYQDDIRPFFDKQAFNENNWQHLFDYNLAIIHKMMELLGVSNHDTAPTSLLYADATKRSSTYDTLRYYQTFQKKHGFIPGLSILDLLFNEGPESILFLCKIPK